MESNTQNAKKDDCANISDLIKAASKKDVDFKKFINKHFYPKESSLSPNAINENIDKLKYMNDNQKALIMARATSYEESYDISKYFPTLIAIFTIILGMYALLREMTGGSTLVNIGSIIITGIVGIYLTRLYVVNLSHRPTAVFFKELLKNIDYE